LRALGSRAVSCHPEARSAEGPPGGFAARPLLYLSACPAEPFLSAAFPALFSGAWIEESGPRAIQS